MEQNTDSSLLEHHVDYDGGNILKETVKWTRFLSIVGFIGIGICVIVFLLLLGAGSEIWSRYSAAFPMFEMFSGAFAFVFIIFLIFLAIFVWAIVLLYRFSTLIRKGIEAQDQAAFNQGLNALKLYFTIMGVLAIIGLIFSVMNLRYLF